MRPDVTLCATCGEIIRPGKFGGWVHLRIHSITEPQHEVVPRQQVAPRAGR